MTQPGYDALAERYSEMFPTPYQSPLERHAVAAFVDLVREAPIDGIVLDVGCGIGHGTADLSGSGLDVIGVEPSREMLRIARHNYSELHFVHDDAQLEFTSLGGKKLAAILARFSLIHLPPGAVSRVFASWAQMTGTGALVAVAGQSTDTVGEIAEFDHAVAPAWRWHPDRVSEALSEAGFDEVWRTISRPDAQHRFPEHHLVARRR